MSGDAGASDSVDHYAMEERAADKLRKGVSNTLQKAKKSFSERENSWIHYGIRRLLTIGIKPSL